MNIREMRAQLGDTQSEFSARYHIPFRTVQNWETGMRKPPEYVADLLEQRIKEDLTNRKTLSLPKYDPQKKDLPSRSSYVGALSWLQAVRDCIGEPVVFALDNALMCQGNFGGRSDEYIVWVYGDDSVMKFNGVVVLGNRIGTQNIKNRNGLLYTDFNRTVYDALANENILDMQGITEAVSRYFYSNGDSFDGLFVAPEYQDRFERLASDAIEYYETEVLVLNVTAEERIMYSVMKAVYDSGIPISFKGSMVLKACLFEAGFLDETRHTVDIDANWNTDTPPTAEQMVESLQRAINRGGMDYEVRLYRMYGEKRSAGFELVDRNTDEILFTMDVDVNRPITPTQIYEVDGICFRGVSPLQMIADKVAVVSTDKVFRRIKDVVDLYYISKVFEFDVQNIYSTLKCSERTMGDFQGFLQRKEDLRHSYDKFRFAGDVNKPPFDAVYREVKIYLKDVLPKEASKEDADGSQQ